MALPIPGNTAMDALALLETASASSTTRNKPAMVEPATATLTLSHAHLPQ